MKAWLGRIGWGLATAVLTVIVWVSLNVARNYYQAQVNQAKLLDAIVQVINYNVQQGKLAVPSPSPTPPAK